MIVPSRMATAVAVGRSSSSVRMRAPTSGEVGEGAGGHAETLPEHGREPSAPSATVAAANG